MSAEIVSNSSHNNTELLLGENLRKVQDWLQSQDIEYRILGRVAIESCIGNGKGGIARAFSKGSDIDILVEKKNQMRIINGIQNKLGSFLYSQVDLSSCRYIDFRPSEEACYLTYRNLRVEVPTKIFESHHRFLNGVEVKTIPARTLFHLFVVCGGTMRSQDWNPALALGRYIRNFGEELCEGDYYKFHEYVKLREEEYPLTMLFVRNWQHILSRLPDGFRFKILRIQDIAVAFGSKSSAVEQRHFISK